jgi:OFA family oxalate/formate antiporter-like MFS transporter
LWLFGKLGWRLTWAIYGGVLAATVSLLSWFFVRDRPEDLGLTLDDDPEDTAVAQEAGHSLREASRTRSYWMLAAAAVPSPMITTAVIFDIQPMLAARGLDASVAALAVSVWSATMAVLALPSGWLVDAFAPGRIIAGGVAAIAAACIVSTVVASPTLALVALSLLALGNSLVAAAIATTTARFFGRAHHGAIRSSLSRIGVIATGLGPLLFGLSQHFTGAVDAALIAFAAFCLPVMMTALWLRPPTVA